MGRVPRPVLQGLLALFLEAAACCWSCHRIEARLQSRQACSSPAAYMDCSVWPSLTSGRLFSLMALLLERVEESLVAEAGFPVLLDPGV